MSELKVEMLQALSAGDRAEGERIRAKQLEEAAASFVREIELINSSFYRIWNDWEALEDIKETRAFNKSIN